MLFQEVGQPLATLLCLEGLARVLGARGRPAVAAHLLAAAAAQRRVLGAPLAPAEQDELDREAAALRGRLGDAAFDAAWAAGQAMTLQQAVASALEENADIA